MRRAREKGSAKRRASGDEGLKQGVTAARGQRGQQQEQAVVVGNEEAVAAKATEIRQRRRGGLVAVTPTRQNICAPPAASLRHYCWN